jgi:hypothetical protein
MKTNLPPDPKRIFAAVAFAAALLVVAAAKNASAYSILQSTNPIRGFNTAQFDFSQDVGYLITDQEVMKVKLSDLTVLDEGTLSASPLATNSSAIDLENGFLYFQTVAGANSRLFKIQLSDLSIVASPLHRATGGMLFDPSTQHLYTLQDGTMTRVNADTLTPIDSVVVTSDVLVTGSPHSERSFISSGYAYLGFPKKIVKVRLSDLVVVDTLTVLTSAINNVERIENVAPDLAHGVAYYAVFNSIVKLDVASFSTTTVRDVGAPGAGGVDGRNGTNYWCGYQRIIAANSVLTSTATLALPSQATFGTFLVVDSTGGYVYAGTPIYSSGGSSLPGYLFKIALSEFSFGAPPPGATLLPTITVQPSNQKIPMSGGSVTFQVTAFNAISYQWQRDGVAIPGAQNASYTLNAGAADSSARFRCIVTNEHGSVASSEATLQIELSMRSYPNPWRADRARSNEITFDGGPVGTTIKLYTLSGRWVSTMVISGDLTAKWNLKHSNGTSAASGYYVFTAESPDGVMKTKGKLAIIR